MTRTFIDVSVDTMVTSLINVSFDRRVRAFLNVFGRLKQKVIWKIDIDSHQDLPSNVKLAKWLPQQDLIGNVNLIIVKNSCYELFH